LCDLVVVIFPIASLTVSRIPPSSDYNLSGAQRFEVLVAFISSVVVFLNAMYPLLSSIMLALSDHHRSVAPLCPLGLFIAALPSCTPHAVSLSTA